jgi:hypothetical protein
MLHDHFDLHNYFEAQALDHLYLMDEISDTIVSTYSEPNPLHPLITEETGLKETPTSRVHA